MVGDDVDGAAARDRADVGGRLGVDAPEAHGRDRAGSGEDRAAAVLGAYAGVRGDAVQLARRCGSGSARRRRLRRAARRCRRRSRRALRKHADLELLGAGQRELLSDREERARRRCRGRRPRQPLGEQQHRRDRHLVVGAEDRLVGVLPAAVADHRLDRGGDRDGVEVGAEAGCCARRCRGCGRAGCRSHHRSRRRRRPRSTSRPIARSRVATASAQARSLRDGLSIRQSAAKVSCRRRRSASLAPVTSRRRTAARVSAQAPRRRTRGIAALGARAAT